MPQGAHAEQELSPRSPASAVGQALTSFGEPSSRRPSVVTQELAGDLPGLHTGETSSRRPSVTPSAGSEDLLPGLHASHRDSAGSYSHDASRSLATGEDSFAASVAQGDVAS